MSAWLFGISPEGIGTVGMMLNSIVTLVSRFTPAPPKVREMVAPGAIAVKITLDRLAIWVGNNLANNIGLQSI